MVSFSIWIHIGENEVTGELWFMCGLEDYTQDDFETLNCSHWCGTRNQQCDSNGIVDASCEDVGCSGSGVPTCTEACRLDYSSCSASSDEMTFQFDYLTDDWAKATSWAIIDEFADEGSGPVWKSEQDYYWNALAYTEFRCMEKGCYRFELYNEEGDGICCEHGNGSYNVLVNGVAVPSINPSFGELKRHQLGSCTQAPFPSTSSMMPSSSPTITAFPTTSAT